MPLGQRYRCDLRRAAPSLQRDFFLARRRTSSKRTAGGRRRRRRFDGPPRGRLIEITPRKVRGSPTLVLDAATQATTRARRAAPRRRRSLPRRPAPIRHHGRQDGLVGPHQPPAQHADQQLPQPARDALTQPETLGWRSGHTARPPFITTGAADGLGRRPIIGDAAAQSAAHPFTFFAETEAQRRGLCGRRAGLRVSFAGEPRHPRTAVQVVDLSQTDYSAEPDLSQPPAPVPAPVYHLTHALLDARAEALKALPLQTKPPTPERHVVGKGASTVSWRLDPWLVNAALGTLITADVYVESRLFAQRQLEVQSADQRVAVDFGSLAGRRPRAVRRPEVGVDFTTLRSSNFESDADRDGVLNSLHRPGRHKAAGPLNH